MAGKGEGGVHPVDVLDVVLAGSTAATGMGEGRPHTPLRLIKPKERDETDQRDQSQGDGGSAGGNWRVSSGWLTCPQAR